MTMTKEKLTYIPQGVCSKRFDFELEGDVITNVTITGGCPGNLLGISRIIKGKTVKEVVDAFQGVHCGAKPTSCPDQIAAALTKHFQSN